jgi:hypothetical protein
MLCKDETGEDCEVVVKWRAGLEIKETGLVCELMAALLADDLDLPVAKPCVVEIDRDFHRGIQRAEISTLAKQSAGMNFGAGGCRSASGHGRRTNPFPCSCAHWPRRFSHSTCWRRISIGDGTTRTFCGVVTRFFSAITSKHFPS